MVQLNTYLNFAGNTEEAFNFYKSVFGGEFTSVVRFKDMPMKGVIIPKEDENKIMHIGLAINDNLLMATDTLESFGQKLIPGNNVHISIHPKSKEEADRLFNALSKDGVIDMPIANQPWDDYYGSFKDKFGVYWMVNYHPEKTITVETTVHAPREKVWTFWTEPKHITKWNNASDDWHTPRAENDVRVGGKFLSRMESKEGSSGFDFTGEYRTVDKHSLIEYTIGDGRKVKVSFVSQENKTTITETFEAENTNSLEMQRAGWQAILDNFKKYVESKMMQKIIPHLWFDKEAKEATKFYTSLFENSKVKNVTTITGTPSGDCDIVTFDLAGQEFMAISAGPYFKLNPSISFFVIFDNNKEIEAVWNTLVDGGKVLMPYNTYPWAFKYGWVQDKYGLSWQLSWSDHKMEQKITPLLMFTKEIAGKTKSAIETYTHIFPNSKTEMMVPYTKDDDDKEGFIKHSRFTLAGENFMAMDSSMPHGFSFNEALSFVVNCDTQEEIDYYWKKLSAVPEAEQCGWLKDQYGVSWQIVPSVMNEMLTSSNKEKIARVTDAFLKMKKFNIEALKRAYEEQ